MGIFLIDSINILFVHKNVNYMYSLEVPQWDTSNAYPQFVIWRKKLTLYLEILSYVKQTDCEETDTICESVEMN